MDDVRAALDAATRRLRATRAEVAALRAYQDLEGDHEHLNAFLDSGGEIDAQHPAYEIVTGLDGLLRRAFLPRSLVVHRGIGDADRVPFFVGDIENYRGYPSTSLDPTVAREFAAGPRPAVLRIVVPEGTRALWVPPLGRRDLRYEQEVLLRRNTPIRYGRRTMDGDVVVVFCEVVPW